MIKILIKFVPKLAYIQSCQKCEQKVAKFQHKVAKKVAVFPLKNSLNQF